MTLRSFYVVPSAAHIFCRTIFIKIRYIFQDTGWQNRMVPAICDSALKRIICTDSKLQGALCCQPKPYPDKKFFMDPDFNLLYQVMQKNSLDAEIFPTVCTNVSIENIIHSQEFKHILSKSSFHYDVNLADRDCLKYMLFSEELGTLIPYDEELHFEKVKHSVDELDKVLVNSSKDSPKKADFTGRPSESQLLTVIEKLTYSLIHFFEKPHDFTMYHKNLVFQNNMKGFSTRGIYAYMQHIYLMKLIASLHYAKVVVQILKITHHVDDGSVRVRWRVNGITRHKVLQLCWKARSTEWKQFANNGETEWLDGFSIFSVGQDGLIYKHICDKMMPDDEPSAIKQNDLRSRLLGLLGLAPRGPAAGGLQASISQGTFSYEKFKL